MLQPARVVTLDQVPGNPLDTPAFVTPPPAQSAPQQDLAREITQTRDAAIDIARTLHDTGSLKLLLKATLESAMQGSIESMKGGLRPITCIGLAVTQGAIFALTVMSSSGATVGVAINGVLAAGLGYFAASLVRTRLAARSPELIATLNLGGINAAANQAHTQVDEILQFMDSAVTESSDPRILRAANHRQTLGQRLQEFRFLNSVAFRDAHHSVHTSQGSIDVVLAANRGYQSIIVKLCPTVERYLRTRSELLARDASLAEHLHLNDAAEDLVHALKAIRREIPRYNLKMPEGAEFRSSGYSIPSRWGVLLGRVPQRLEAQPR